MDIVDGITAGEDAQELLTLQSLRGWGIIIFMFLMFIIFCWIWAKLTYKFYKYELREDGFRKERGIIWKKYVTIPYDRIQNVDIHRGLVARMLGLSDIRIQTAGASKDLLSEGFLPGLSEQVARELRDELLTHKSKF